MINLRVLNQEVVKEVLDMRSVIQVVEQAYVLKATNQAILFPMIYHEFEPGKADMDIKSGYIEGAGIFGLKLVSWFSQNGEKNLPVLTGTVMVLDSKTGLPVGILSGEHITCMRTGAAGAIGAKYLARSESENLLLVGTGHQAPYQIAATLMVMDNIKNVMVYNSNSFEKANRFCSSIGVRLEDDFLSKYKEEKDFYELLKSKYDVNFIPVDKIENAAKAADIIITATPSRRPLIMKDWIKPGVHFSCIGADMEGKQEIDENIFRGARIIVDDVTQAVNVGETEIPVKKSVITKQDIIDEIGNVILGKADGRVSGTDVTIFDSTGIAFQDLLTANYVLAAAKEKNAGVVVDL